MAIGTATRHLQHWDFEQRAEAIIGLLEVLRPQVGLSEAQTQLWERFVEHEPGEDLRRFSEIIADGRRQATTQRQLDEDREQLHHGDLNHEGRVAVGHHYEMLRREACIYNHLLRGLIARYGDQLNRHELTDWLTRASLGVHSWVVGEITGAVSEVALHAAIMGLPELEGSRYATVDEDLTGYDFVAHWQGDLVTIDAKSGLYRPLTIRKHGHLHLEVSVPREAIEDFRITRRGLDILRREVRQALHADYESRVHAPHRYYQ